MLMLVLAGTLIVWRLQIARPVEVDILQPLRGDIESVIRVTGKVINDRTVTLTALVDGQIKAMHVHKGQKVKTGQVLAKLDDREANAYLNRVTAEVERERQAVTESYRKLQRLREVSLSGGASEQLLEDTKAVWLTAKARLRVSEANLKIAHVYREKVEVTAPFDGVITEKTTEVGQWLEAGTQLFTLVAHEGREIEANVDAGDSGEISIGQPVTMTTDAYPGKHWQEKIHWISPSISEDEKNALNTFAVRMTLGPDAPSLLLNQQVDIRIQTDLRRNVLKLPFTALVEDRQDTKVAVLHKGKVNFVTIKTGIEDFNHVEIEDGLAEKDIVILMNGISLSEGQVVTPK